MCADFPGHENKVEAVAVSPDGKTVLTGSGGRTTHFWNAETGRHAGTPPVSFSSSTAEFSPDGKRLYIAWYGNGLARIMTSGGKQIAELDHGAAYVRALRLVRNGERLVTLARFASVSPPQGRLTVWNTATREKLAQLTIDRGRGFAVTEDGRFAATSQRPGIGVWDLEQQALVARLGGQEHYPAALQFTPGGRYLISGGRDQTIRVWEMASGQAVHALRGHTRPIGCLDLSPDGRTIVSGGGVVSIPIESATPRKLRFWDLTTGAQIGELSGHGEDVTAVAFTPDGGRIVAGLQDTTALIFNVPPAARRRKMPRAELSVEEIASLIDSLGEANAAEALAAIERLAAVGEPVVDPLAARLSPAAAPDAKRVGALLAQLADDEFRRRQAAAAQLARLGNSIAGELREAANNSPSAEVRARCRDLLTRAEHPFTDDPAELLALRGIQLLERLKSRSADDLLARLAAGHAPARHTIAARAALSRRRTTDN